MATTTTATPLEIVPLTPERWDDLEQLFGPNGAYSNCWCMWWRLPNAQYNACTPTERHERFRAVATLAGHPPGLLAYREGVPVGWCAIAPRADFPRLNRSRNWHPLDDQPVWSLNCFYITAKHRRTGVATALIYAAIDFAADQGARIVEAYPRETIGKVAAVAICTGTAQMFLATGFTEVARRHPERPMMRLLLDERQ
jgi:GNAT superfamily N-acetyltransferase